MKGMEKLWENHNSVWWEQSLKSVQACLLPNAVSVGKSLSIPGTRPYCGTQAGLTFCTIMPRLAHLLLFIFFFYCEGRLLAAFCQFGDKNLVFFIAGFKLGRRDFSLRWSSTISSRLSFLLSKYFCFASEQALMFHRAEFISFCLYICWTCVHLQGCKHMGM